MDFLAGYNVIEPMLYRRKYRRWIVTDLQRIVDKRTRAERVMALLIESGVFYIFSGVSLSLISSLRQ